MEAYLYKLITDQDGRPAHEMGVYARSSIPRNLNNEPPLGLAAPGTGSAYGFYVVPVNRNNEPPLSLATIGSAYIPSGFFEDILHKAKGPFIGIAEQINSYLDMWDDAKGVYKNFSQGPGLYKHIGRDAKGLLFFDYSFDMLRLEPTNMSNLVCGAGVTSVQNFPLRKLFLSLKHANTAFDLNGTMNDNLLAKISFDGVLGANTRGVLYLPLPSFKSKFEFQAFYRFAGISGGIGTGIRPCHEVSCLLGVKLFSFGGSLKYNPSISEWSSSGGISVQIPNASIGLTMSFTELQLGSVCGRYSRLRSPGSIWLLGATGGRRQLGLSSTDMDGGTLIG